MLLVKANFSLFSYFRYPCLGKTETSKFEKEARKEYSSSMFALCDTNRTEGEDKIRFCSSTSIPHQEWFQIF